MAEPSKDLSSVFSLMKSLASGAADLEPGILALQTMIWDGLQDEPEDGPIEVLRDLAFDLEFCLFGPPFRNERAIQHIKTALERCHPITSGGLAASITKA